MLDAGFPGKDFTWRPAVSHNALRGPGLCLCASGIHVTDKAGSANRAADRPLIECSCASASQCLPSNQTGNELQRVECMCVCVCVCDYPV